MQDGRHRVPDESVWQLPVEKRYRRQLDSNIADIRAIGSDHPDAITAALEVCRQRAVGAS
jgi:leucyl aminopeptidase